MEEVRCRRCDCILEPDDPFDGLCGDCYWDDQTDGDGDINP